MTASASGLVALLINHRAVRPSARPVTPPAQPTAPSGCPIKASFPLPRVARQNPSLPVVAGNYTDHDAAAHPRNHLGSCPAGACEGKTIDGPTVDTRWGPVQVEAVISPTGQICDVDASSHPLRTAGPCINAKEAPPILRRGDEGSRVPTSMPSAGNRHLRGYQRSLQSILDGVGG
jgi:hypothetical protein